MEDNNQSTHHPSPGKGEKDGLPFDRYDDLKEQARLFAESQMPEGWNRKDHILVAAFYNEYIAYLFKFIQPPSPKQDSITKQEISSLRWLLNKTSESPRMQVGKSMDRTFDKDHITIRQHLESIWAKLSQPPSPSSPGEWEALEKIMKYAKDVLPERFPVDDKILLAVYNVYHTARKALSQSHTEVKREAGVRMFEAFDSVNKRVTDRTVYMDQEGDLYEDQDPHGVDMSGTRRIKSTIRYTLYQSKNK
jgi:hypothetical protein